MADPITIGAIGLGASALGAGVSAFGSMQQGAAQQAMYQYQAGVARVNQQIAAQNAEWELKAGEVEAQQEGLKTRFGIGTAKTEQAASGLDVNSGSALATRQSMQEIGTYNETLARANAAKRAYGFTVQGVQEEAQSNIDIMAGQQARTAGNIGAVTSILGGISNVSSKWMQGRNVGLWG